VVVNELTLVAILRLLAERYPDFVKGSTIISTVRIGRSADIRKCLAYLKEKGHIDGSDSGVDEIDTMMGSWVLTARGVDYLGKETEKLREILEEIKRKPMGFNRPDSK